MSHINDALKRAKQSQQQQKQNPPPVPALLPLEPPARGDLSWLFPIVIVALVLIACLFIALAFVIRKPAVESRVAISSEQSAPAPAPQKRTPVAASPTPAPAPSAVPVETPAPPPAPVLKLQGIFYNTVPPQAIVNGQTVYVGDLINGFRVKLISRNNVVFLAPDGSEKTLTLNE